MLTVGSVGYLGSAPALAVFGLASVFLYVLPAFVFLVPVSLVAAELASGWPGGVYNWVGEGISAPMGLLAVWCEFAQTIFYYPALLAYVAGTLAYVFDPGLAGNGVYNAVVIIVLFWGGVLVTHTRAGARGQARLGRNPARDADPGRDPRRARRRIPGPGPNHSAAPMTARHLLPPWTGLASIVLVVNSFFTYAGIEVNAVHVDELRNPGREYPKSIFLAMALVLAVFIGPTLAISWVIPSGSDQLHRRRDAGLQQPVHPLRGRVRRAADRDRPGGRGARRDDFLAGRPVRGAAEDRARAGVSSRLTSRRSPARASRCASSPRRAP